MTEKRSSQDWALFGGRAAFREPLHVGAPNVGDRSRLFSRLGLAFERRRLTNDGPFVRELEERLAEQAGVAHCVAVSSATVGLSLVARALDLGGSVVMPALTFVGTAHAFEWVGVRPVFADVEGRQHGLDPQSVARRIAEDTGAIVGVHLWGRGCDVEGLEALGRARGLPVIFDAAHGYGCSSHGRALTASGDVAVLSLHATKVVNSFEGGALLTSDAGLAARLRLMRNFGFQGYDAVSVLGTNAKMSEAAAAMALTCIESYGEFVAANRAHYEEYQRELADLPGVKLAGPEEGDVWHHHNVVVEVEERESGIGRDDIMRLLWAENVRARRYFYPGCHRMAPYGTRERGVEAELPVTDRLCGVLMQLPTGTTLEAGQAARVGRLVRRAVELAGAIADRLRGLEIDTGAR